jgi:hypothetical protein
MLRMRRGLVRLTIILLIGLFTVNAILSLRWRFQLDSPILLYMTWLMDRFGYVPYRDLFDMNMPGTYAFNYLIGRMSGYSDLGVRLVDLAILGVTLVISWHWMKTFGSKVALCGSVLWGLCYLQLGSTASIQREYLILFPVLAAVSIAGNITGDNSVQKSSAIGFLFGVAAVMKPHAAIALPFLLLFQHGDRKRSDFLFRIVLPSTIGFFLPIVTSLLYLWYKGALTPFLDISLNYWPLYIHLSGEHQTLYGIERLRYLWNEFHNFGGFSLWLVPSTIGAYASVYRSTLTSSQKRQVKMLVFLAVCYGLYPLIAGQFWGYHWLLFLYFVVQLSALCMVDLAPQTGQSERVALVAILLIYVVLLTRVPEGLVSDIQGHKPPPIKNGRVDRIADFLSTHLQPGDRVQPLDWTGGAVHAMLISKAQLATPFVYDFHFYHDISNAYIQNLRQKFILGLQQSQARFVVQVVGDDKPWVHGKDTTREFEELQTLLDKNYAVVDSGDGYFIYELRHDSNKK